MSDKIEWFIFYIAFLNFFGLADMSYKQKNLFYRLDLPCRTNEVPHFLTCQIIRVNTLITNFIKLPIHQVTLKLFELTL